MTADDGLLDEEVVMRKDEEMRELLSRWESSGVTQRAFAEQEGVPYSTLVYWRRRLKLDEERAEVQPEKPAFAPVRVVAPSLRDRCELRIDQLVRRGGECS
jgi:transposase-like protein